MHDKVIFKAAVDEIWGFRTSHRCLCPLAVDPFGEWQACY